MSRRSVVICLLVVFSLGCLFLVSPAPVMAAEENVSTTVYFFDENGTYIQLLQYIGSSSAVYRVQLDYLEASTWVFNLLMSTDMTIGEPVATYLYTAPDDDSNVRLVFGDCTLWDGDSVIVPTGEISSLSVLVSDPEVTTTVNLYGSAGTVLDTLSVSAAASVDVTLHLAAFGVNQFKLTLSAGDQVDSVTYFAVPASNGYVNGSFGTLTPGNSIVVPSGDSSRVDVGIASIGSDADESLWDSLLGWIDDLRSVFAKVSFAISSFRDNLFFDLDFNLFGGFADFLSGIWYSFPGEVRAYAAFGVVSILFSTIVWRGGVI